MRRRLALTKEAEGDMSTRDRLAGCIILRIDLSTIGKRSTKEMLTTNATSRALSVGISRPSRLGSKKASVRGLRIFKHDRAAR